MAVDECIYLMNETLEFGFKNLRCDGVFQSAWGKNFGSFGIKWLGQTLWQIKALRRFLWSKGKFATEKENSGSVVFEASEASGIGLDGLDFGIDPFREGVGDVAVEIGQNIG
jgi:hypothetical protein